jgi:hypothetical protein
MPISIDRKAMLPMYQELRAPRGFLQRFFTVKPGGIHKSNTVEIDIQRFDEDVAIAVTRCTGPNLNTFEEYTTKEFTPPTYDEGMPFDVCDLLQRMVGIDPYSAENIEYSAQLRAKLAQGWALLDSKIGRAVELQASQILQTGILTLINSDGDTVYTLDFKPKAAHFPTVGTSWSAGGDKLGDLESLAEAIRANGKISPNMLLMGSTALKNFKADTEVQKFLDNHRMEQGELNPRFENSGSTRQGRVWVGDYEFSIWTYPETYTHPQTGLPTKYIDADKVIMLSDQTRLDMTSSVVPMPFGPDSRIANLLPGRLSSREAGFDVTPNLSLTNDNKQLTGSIESRTLLLPVQIDGFGCLDTKI